LPIYTRFTGPAQDPRSRRSSYIIQDWVMLPRLVTLSSSSPETPPPAAQEPKQSAPDVSVSERAAAHNVVYLAERTSGATTTHSDPHHKRNR
jgi:hypothetical protein